MPLPPSHPVQGDPFSGQRLGRYDVHCRLTVGGMSDVLLASTRGAGGFRRLVVLKQILPDIKRNPDFVRMFLNEARMMALFSHPHIAQVYDLEVFEEELFLAMEFVPGATLIEVAQACHRAREHIPVGLTLMAVRDTARALHHAHTFTDPAGKALPVVHRDVTQRNIMLTYDGVTKLLDFGIAKLPDRTALTAVGTIKGTSGYLSPEQIAGEHPDHRSDIFSLGVVLHECLTGLRLFPGPNMVDAMRATLQTEIPPPSSKNPAVPSAVDAVVLRALSRKREDRQSSALELAKALETAVPASIWHPEDASVLLKQLFKQRHADVSRLLADFTVALDDLSDPRIRRLVGLSPLTPSRGARVGTGVRPAVPAPSVEGKPAEAAAVTSPSAALPVQPPVLVPPPVLLSPQPVALPPPLPTVEMDAVPTHPPHAVVADEFDITVERETPTLPTMPAVVIPIAEQDTQPRVRLADIKPPDVPWHTHDPRVSAAARARHGSWWNGLFGKR